MSALREWAGDFDLGDLLGVGLDTSQIGHLAGALFLTLFGLSALRRATLAGGPFPAVWIAAGVALIGGAALVAARGFPDQVPDDLKPWTMPDRLGRAAAALALLGCAVVFLSAYWLRGRLARFGCRLAGLATAGLAVWLAAGWFGDQLPDEARPWAAREVVTCGLAVVGLVILAGAFWVRETDVAPHARWAGRVFAGPALALATILAVRWFGTQSGLPVPAREVVRIAAVLGAVSAGTCVVIAAGSYWLRERPTASRQRVRSAAVTQAPPPVAARPLPVAVLLDEQGRPVLPNPAPHVGRAGA